jgi:hypothetical protein
VTRAEQRGTGTSREGVELGPSPSAAHTVRKELETELREEQRIWAPSSRKNCHGKEVGTVWQSDGKHHGAHDSGRLGTRRESRRPPGAAPKRAMVEQVPGAGTLGPGARELREQLGRAGRWGGAAELEAGERAQRAAGGATTTGCRKEAELGLQGTMGDGRREEQPTRWRSSGRAELDGATRTDEPDQGRHGHGWRGAQCLDPDRGREEDAAPWEQGRRGSKDAQRGEEEVCHQEKIRKSV